MPLVEIRVYYEDTDGGGVVYYANYLRYLERARTEYLRERGVNLAALIEGGYTFVVKAVQVDYIVPARYDDLLTVETDLVPGRARLEFTHTIERNGTLIARASCDLACVGVSGKPVGIPEEVKRLLKSETARGMSIMS